MTRAILLTVVLGIVSITLFSNRTATAVEADDGWVVDQICFAQWADTELWFAARVIEVGDDGTYKVQYFDGDEEWRAAEKMTPDRLAADDPVGVLVERDGEKKYLPGVIAERRGMRFTVTMDDGTAEETTITFLRVRFE